MIKMLCILALLLLFVLCILLVAGTEERLNIPIIRDIRHWIEKNRFIGYTCLYGIIIILGIIVFTH